MKIINHFTSGPYRLFFPLGTLFLLWGTLIWLPQIWTESTYPVLAHRYLMLNGFSASFIAGFLMTAVPNFSQTDHARPYEVYSFLAVTFVGLYLAFIDAEKWMFFTSALQAGFILSFLFKRIFKRKANPPYSFIFIFVGLGLWLYSAVMSTITFNDLIKSMHYEGAIAALIIGVGSRLIPGILGHTEIVQTQRSRYETTAAFLKTAPLGFYVLMFIFVFSFFIQEHIGHILRTMVTTIVAFTYWRLHKFPKEKSSLTWCIWCACWLILLSFLIKAIWINGGVHASHSFFFSATVLLTFLISIRVLQSHGPGDKKLENLVIIYCISFLIILAGATRVSAILFPESYLRHLGYSSLTLTLAVLIWSYRYLRYVLTFK